MAYVWGVSILKRSWVIPRTVIPPFQWRRTLDSNIDDSCTSVQCRNSLAPVGILWLLGGVEESAIEISAWTGIPVFGFWRSVKGKGISRAWGKWMNFHEPPPIRGCGCDEQKSVFLSYMNLSSQYVQYCRTYCILSQRIVETVERSRNY